MTVFLVFGIWHYDGSNLLGVYDTYEKAAAAAEVARVTPCFPGLPGVYDEVTVEERTVQ